MERIDEVKEQIKGLQAELKVLEKDAEAESNRRFKLKEAAFKALPKEWSVTPHTEREFCGTGLWHGARINFRRANYAEFVREWGEYSASTGNMWQGLFYYRTDEGILTHTGGGSLVLKTPMLCSDEEWASILAGNIPEKFFSPKW